MAPARRHFTEGSSVAVSGRAVARALRAASDARPEGPALRLASEGLSAAVRGRLI